MWNDQGEGNSPKVRDTPRRGSSSDDVHHVDEGTLAYRVIIIIRAWEQRIDIGKYSFVNTTIKLRNQPPTEALASAFPLYITYFQEEGQEILRCMHRASPYNMYINQQDAQNSCD